VNPRLDLLQPYPFERLRALFAGVTPPAGLPGIRLSIGEPQHATPQVVRDALAGALDDLSSYPATAGSDRLREAIASWCTKRWKLPPLDPARDVLPVNGSREALFAFAQAVIDTTAHETPIVVMPNPFYQIYEGAARLAGAEPRYVPQLRADGYVQDWSRLPDDEWRHVQLVYVCTPGNPNGHVMSLDEWCELFALSDRYGFVIASDECYSEIYPDEENPPLGALEAAARLGRSGYENLVVFTSLSKRSNVPGLRSGAVAGDRRLLGSFLRYRTYHGCAMGPAVQAASIAAWSDEQHVVANRDMYRAKFEAVVPVLEAAAGVAVPDGGFYLWARVPGDDDEAFARGLLERANVTVLPGRYLAREVDGIDPGRGFVRLALVTDFETCVEAARRIAAYCADV
jgi:N-succinyldiaminopimelate aminotransferase